MTEHRPTADSSGADAPEHRGQHDAQRRHPDEGGDPRPDRRRRRTDGGRRSRSETDGGVADVTDGRRNDTDPVGSDSAVNPHVGLRERLVRGLRDDRRALAGAVVVVLFVVVALSAPLVAPYGPETTFGPFQEPMTSSQSDLDGDGSVGSHLHPLGTNSFGHDMLSRIVYGSQVSLVVAFVTVAFAFGVGTTIGLVAGYYGGWVDSLLMRYVDFQWAFPELILAVGLIAFTGGTGPYDSRS